MSEKLQIKILQGLEKNSHFVVIHKPSGLPSAPLSETDTFNAFSQAADIFPELKNVKGRENCMREHGLLHRLDTVTSGLILIAADQKTFDFLQTAQKNGSFVKYYRAICRKDLENSEKLENFPPRESDFVNLDCSHKIIVKSRFRSFGKNNSQVRPVSEKSGMAAQKKSGKKEYSTEILIQKKLDNERYLVDCKISEGFRHQIRSHLAWAGFPIINDILYDSEKTDGGNFIFQAYQIQFPDPETNEQIVFSVPSDY